MGVTSDVQICNSALRKLGSEPILSLSDDSTRARLVSQAYVLKRQELLRSHPWNFAKKRVELSATVNEPLFGFGFEFQLPADCMRVLALDLPYTAKWAVEQDKLYTDDSPVRILYVADVLDVSKFDDNFCEVLAWAVASDIVYALTQSTSQVELVEAKYQQALQLARSFNAQEGSLPRVIADNWLDRRRT
jgi:hypothetical protein